ncbi:MAG: DNA internalization-related competence protein ComEC/Rec2 [Gallionella sp.]|nr:DNA internalization-related competence protein ComEC/Rec2 [Gallionella sp.]MDD4946433.1 DNA internalization-related competence protein ComEC/Rec2 [Gallionella sp.]MDD5611844.1 DNA internalization-related competence protein ComEC/Rec2 [Gallionella sp.]
MILFTLPFTFGVWLLQQQAALPDFGWAWPLVALPLALLMPQNSLTQRLLRAALIAMLASGLGYFHAAWQAERRLADFLPADWQGRDIAVTGVVAGLPHSNERSQRFRFDVERVLTPNAHVPAHLYLSTYSEARSQPLTPRAGERWKFTVRLKQPHGSSNPQGFDFELWALENNLRAVGYVHNSEKFVVGHPKEDNFRLDAQADGFAYRVESWREAIRDRFDAVLGDAPYRGVLTALAIGDQGSIPQPQWQIFTRTGINHLVSISGLHITMLASLAFSLVYWLWRRNTRLTLWLPARKAAAAAALLVALGYALLAGFGVPAQRTVYMVAAVAAALWLNRNFSLAQIFCFALLGVLIPDPWAVLSPGFWLSFGAVALIFYVTAHRLRQLSPNTAPDRRAARALHGLTSVLREYAAVQWAMSIGLIPLLLGLFQQVSLVSPLANAFAIPLVSLVVVPLTLLGAALPLDTPLWLAHQVIAWTMIPLQWLNSLPAAVWTQHAPPPWSIVTGMLGVLWILLPAGFPLRWLGVPLLLPMFLNTPEPPRPDSLRLIIFDVGQGLSVAAQTAHHALLYDTGPDYSGDADSGNRILVPTLRALGIRELDGVMLSHDDLDHTAGTASVLQAIPTGWLSSSLPVNETTLLPDNHIDTRLCRDGVTWDWDGVHFEVLHPAARHSSKPHDNDLSCVLRISIGRQHVLLTGDITKKSEQRLLRDNQDQLAASLLVVPHHGSSGSSSSEFVAAVLPDYAVFTNGYRNRFDHPKPEVVQRYADSGAELLRSDDDGAILVGMDATRLGVERYRKTHRHYWTHFRDHP